MNDYDMKVHLGFIQAAINKNRDYSADCKKWALTIFFASSFFSSSLNIPSANIIMQTLIGAIYASIIVLWYLDAEYERTAQMYHKLYDAVRLDKDHSISPYDMSIDSFEFKGDFKDFKKAFAVFRIMWTWKIYCLYIVLILSIYNLAKLMKAG